VNVIVLGVRRLRQVKDPELRTYLVRAAHRFIA